MSSGVTVGQSKESVIHSRFAEALTAKLDRGGEGDNETGICRIREKTRLESYYSYCQILIVEEMQPIANTDKRLEPSYVIENLLVTAGIIPTALRAQGQT